MSNNRVGLIMMNSYFKTAEEINQLFQKAFEALEQHGYAAATTLFDDAFRHDPYRLQAHYKLALHFAAINHAAYFQHHFFVCWNIDATYKEKITTDNIVVNALGNALIAEIVAAKKLKSEWSRRHFISIDPAEYNCRLIFKPDQKKAIAAVYASLDDSVTKYFKKHKINDEPSDLFEEYLQPDFEKIDYFWLEHSEPLPLTGCVDCAPETLYTTLQRLSEYLDNNVRFLVTSEDDNFVDEVIILNGAFHLYRHQAGEFYYHQNAYFETIVNSYPEDRMLRSWLCHEYQKTVLYASHDVTKELNNAMRLSTPEDPWMPYILGKLALNKKDRETALKYFKEAAAKTSYNFEICCDIAAFFYDNGMIGEAEQCYDRVIEQDPLCLIALNIKSLIRFEQKDYKAAIEAAEQSISADPNHYHPYYVLARIYNQQGRSEDTLQMVKKVLSLDPLKRYLILNEPDLAGLKEKVRSL